MSLAYFARNASNGERTRRRILREGMTMAGQKLWTDVECETVREHVPDYDAIAKLLPHRTRAAIVTQAAKMGLRKSINIWTGAQISKLRKLYPRASKEEICATFAFSSWVNICQVARYHKLSRARKPYKPTGVPALDGLLEKCVEANMRLADLDMECRTKKYFHNHKWRYRRLNYNRFIKAVELLDGKIEVRWPDEGQ
jgi:hypothetical protein